MDTTAAAVLVLADLRRRRADKGDDCGLPACMWINVGRAARSSAFRLLSKKGLAEDVNDGRYMQRMWRATDKAMSLRDGEEFSAVS